MDQASNDQGLRLDPVNIRKSALILRSLNHKLRQAIIKLLHERDKMSVTEIFVALRVEQSVASQHLAILRTAGFLITSRDGKNIYYSINRKKLDETYKLVLDMINL
jgi:DNA-binding transcriptional ArsR family regulator